MALIEVTPGLASIDGGELIQLTSESPGVWTTNIGSLWNNADMSSPYIGTSTNSIYLLPFNRTQSGVAVVTSGPDSGSTAIDVIGTFPASPHYPLEWEGDKIGVVASRSRSGRVRGRIVSDSEYVRNYKLMFMNRTPAQIAELEEFYDNHYPDKIFKYENKWNGITGYFQYESKSKGKAESRMKGVYEVAIAQVPQPLGG